MSGTAEPLRLALVSTSRADFGAQAPVHRAALADSRFVPTLIITGQHLADGTPRADEMEGIAAIRLPDAPDSLGHVHQRALIAALRERRCEAVLVNGDRYELLDVAAACSVAGLVFAHAAGGERTLGALDDGVRDALSKLSHLHYPVHAPAGARLRALDEDAERICVAGEPALDALLSEPRPSAAELGAELGRTPRRGDLVVALHPATRCPEELPEALAAVLAIIADAPQRAVFLSSVNRDPGGERIVQVWDELAGADARVLRLASLGNRRFRALVAACGVLIGNSSAGLYEAPSLGARTVDLGARQRGRVAGASVRRVDPLAVAAAVDAARWARAGDGSAQPNPYGDGMAAPRILDHLWRHARRAGVMIKPPASRQGAA